MKKAMSILSSIAFVIFPVLVLAAGGAGGKASSIDTVIASESLESALYQEQVKLFQNIVLDLQKDMSNYSAKESAKTINFMSKLNGVSVFFEEDRDVAISFSKLRYPSDSTYGPFPVTKEYRPPEFKIFSTVVKFLKEHGRTFHKSQNYDYIKSTINDGSAFVTRFQAFKQGWVNLSFISLVLSDTVGRYYSLQVLKPLMPGDSFPSMYQIGLMGKDPVVYDASNLRPEIDGLGEIRILNMSSVEGIFNALENRKVLLQTSDEGVLALNIEKIQLPEKLEIDFDPEDNGILLSEEPFFNILVNDQ